MKKDPIVFLRHILNCIDAIESYIVDSSEGEFMVNGQKQDAVIRRLEVIGEAIKNLPPDFILLHPDVEWQRITATRNFLIHVYWGLDLGLIWRIVTNDLPKLKPQIRSLIPGESKR